MTNRYLWRPLRKRFLPRLHTEENGQSLVIFSLFLTIFIGILGIVLDVGYSNVMQRQMQLAADAAALAGAHDLASAQGGGGLLGGGDAENTALARMQAILTANKADVALSDFEVIDGSRTDVVARASVPTLFSGLFGIDQIEVAAHASAAIGQLIESGNLMPFVIEQDEWALGQSVALWKDKNGPGNFGWVHWAGQGPNTPTLSANISNPSQSDVVAIGDRINGHTGVSFKPVQGDLNAWIGETVTIILYDADEIEGSGHNLTYKVAGFAKFVMTGTYSQGNNSEIYGTFVSYVAFGQAINPGVTTGAQGIGLLQ